MDLDIWEWTQNQIDRHGFIEPLTSSLYQRLLGVGDVYVDVGAHVGYHTLVARKAIQESGKVFAIEPLPYNCSKLLNNWWINGFENVMLFPAAAGRDRGFVCIKDQPPKDRSRLSLNAPSIPGDQPQTICVPVIRLDQIIEMNHVQCIALLKIDAEGYETEVIEGLGDAIKIVHNLIVELCEPQAERSQNLIRYLRSHNFNLENVRGESWNGSTVLPENNLLARFAA